MEETLRFSVFKEKIIKTNELLHLHLEKSREVDKLHRCYQQLKAKLELCKEENKKLQLKNEALSYNSQLNEKELGPLREQYNQLKQQEDANGKIINELQINYQLVCQELEDCKAKLSKLEEHSVPEIIEKKNGIRKSPVKRGRKPKNEIEVDTTPVLNTKINELVTQKNKIVTENSNLKLEIYKLKKEITNLQLMQNDAQEDQKSDLNAKEQEINDLKLKLKSVEEDKDVKINKLLKKLEHIKLTNSNLKEENEKLKNENSSYQIEISMLQTNVEEMDTNQDFSDKTAPNDFTQFTDLQDNMEQIEEDFSNNTEPEDLIPPDVIPDNNVKIPSDEDIRNNVKTPSDEDIEKIFNEMTLPPCLSPVPNLNIGEYMLFNDDTLTQQTGVLRQSSVRKKQIISSSGEFMVSDFSDITKIATKKYKHKRRKKVLKKKSNKIDLLGALIALKEANINFTVSSGACVQFERLDSVPVRNPYSVLSTKPILCGKSIEVETFSCKLECSLACCKNSFMALKGSKGENASLLGFFDVKNENVKQFKEQLKKSDGINCTLRKRKQDEHSNDRPRKKVNKLKNSPQHVEVTDTINEVEETVNSFISDNFDTEIAPVEENPIVLDARKTTRHTTRSSNSFSDSNTVDEASVVLDNSDSGSNKIEMRRTRSSSTCDNNAMVDETSVVLETNNVNRRKTRSCSALLKSNKKIYKTRNALKKSVNKPIFNKQTICDDSGASLPVRKRIAHTPNNAKLVDISDKNSQKATTPGSVKLVENVDGKNSQKDITHIQKGVESIPESESHVLKALPKSKLEKTCFKRPLCRTRQATKLIAAQEQTQSTSETSEVVSERLEEVEAGPPKCPESPTPENKSLVHNKPKIIPLERVNEVPEKMPTSKIEMLFTKLVNYSLEEEVLNEVVSEFVKQDPEYIALAILEKISKDFYDPADSKYSPAPLMTETQRTMLGFMSKLEKSDVIGVFDSFLTLAEHRLLTCQDLHEITPITRLYLAVCKLHHNLHRMRKLCCDMFYFCGDFAVPFFFFVLTSWSEVLPHEAKSKDMPLARVLVQIIYMKECNRPGYNLMPLRDLLIKFYGYPTERWDSNELFQELFHGYLRNPVRSSDFALLLLCKNHPEKWVHEKIEEHLKPIVNQIPAENFKAAVIIFIGNLYNRFSSKSQINYLPGVRQWLTSLLNETTPDVVKRSVYLCLNRLKKK